MKKHASRVFTSAKTEAVADAAAVADRFDTAVEPEEEPVAPEVAHNQLPVDPDDTKSSNVDPYPVEVDMSTVGLFVLEATVDEPLDPSPLVSCPLPPASLWMCILQNRDRNIYPNLVPRAPNMKKKINFIFFSSYSVQEGF